MSMPDAVSTTVAMLESDLARHTERLSVLSRPQRGPDPLGSLVQCPSFDELTILTRRRDRLAAAIGNIKALYA